jgi:hypothetical protein
MKHLMLFSLLILLACPIFAGDPPKYEVSKITEELKKGAQAVVRADEEIIEIIDIGKSISKIRYAITIFDEDANYYATKRVGYDKLTKIISLEGRVYDAEGKVISKLKKADIEDVAAFDGSSFVSDNRMKIAKLARSTFPYTVEFEYEVESKNLLFYGVWYPQPNAKVSVESSIFEVVTPKDFPELRYQGQNLSSKVEIAMRENKKVYQWVWKNLAVRPKSELYSPSLFKKAEFLLLAPTTFEVEGYKGDMTSWKNLGLWNLLLNEGREELPPATQAKVQELVANSPSKLDKIKTLYEYMQSKTRYVGIQLGIGGWQPFPAAEVDSKGYGDCKALSNYMKSLLKVAGINAYYTLIKAGDEGEKEEFLPNFPSAQFNHVILCVPIEKDTVWLECTSQTQATGYMSDFTDDRYALLVMPEGGKLVKTPTYQRKDNMTNRTATVKLDAEGNATATMNTTYQGLVQEKKSMGYIGYLTTLSKEEQKKRLYEKINIPNFEITDFELSRQKSRVPIVTEDLKLKISALASKSGKRLFLQPNLLSKWEKVPEETENRKEEVQISDYDFANVENITYELPEGYYLEHKPEDVTFQSVFGAYKASTTVEGNKITYTRQISINKGLFPKEKYKEWVEFYKNVAKADKMKIVVVSKT